MTPHIKALLNRKRQFLGERRRARFSCTVFLVIIHIQIVRFVFLFFKKKPSWDRVGLIELPEFRKPSDRKLLKLTNVNVTEAVADGVCSRSLKEVCDGALEVSIRPLRLTLATPNSTFQPNERLREHARVSLLREWYSFIGPVVNRSYQVCFLLWFFFSVSKRRFSASSSSSSSSSSFASSSSLTTLMYRTHPQR